MNVENNIALVLIITLYDKMVDVTVLIRNAICVTYQWWFRFKAVYFFTLPCFSFVLNNDVKIWFKYIHQQMKKKGRVSLIASSFIHGAFTPYSRKANVFFLFYVSGVHRIFPLHTIVVPRNGSGSFHSNISPWDYSKRWWQYPISYIVWYPLVSFRH